MPDPIQPQGSIPAQPALTPTDLLAQQAARQSDIQAQNQLDQKNLQRKAEKNIFRRIYNKTIKPGSLITFQYQNVGIHDHTPLVLIGKLNDWNKPGYVAGINFHYLTLRYIKQMVQVYCGKNFNYHLIKGNKYIVNAYRTYKKTNRKWVRILDCDFLNGVLKVTRSFKPHELEKIRQHVQAQLKEKMHPDSQNYATKYQEALHTQPHQAYNTGREFPDSRFNPTNLQPPQ